MIAAWCSAVARAASPELRELFEATVDAQAIERERNRCHIAIQAKYLRPDWRGRMVFEDDDERFACERECERARESAVERLGPARERLRLAEGVYESRHAAPGTRFYVTVRRDDGAAVALAGPYVTHREALEALPEAKRLARRDPRACWYAYGTAAIAGNVTAAFGVVT